MLPKPPSPEKPAQNRNPRGHPAAALFAPHLEEIEEVQSGELF